MYLALIVPDGRVLWLTSSGAFSAAPTRMYAGPMPSFGSSPFVMLPNVAALPAGAYYWVAIADADSNGVPNGTYVDVVRTDKPPALAGSTSR